MDSKSYKTKKTATITVGDKDVEYTTIYDAEDAILGADLQILTPDGHIPLTLSPVQLLAVCQILGISTSTNENGEVSISYWDDASVAKILEVLSHKFVPKN